MKNKIKVIAMVFGLVAAPSYASKYVLGDTGANTFSFTLLKKSIFDESTGLFYVASAVGTLAGDQRPYALTGISSLTQTSIPFSPEKAVVNGSEQANPLYGAEFSQIDFASGRPVLVSSNGLTIYWVSSALGAASQSLVSVDGILDGAGDQSAGVVKVTDTPSGSGNTCAGIGEYLFAAVKPFGGVFGEPNGGIAAFKKVDNTLIQQKAVDGNNIDILAMSLGVMAPVLKMGAADLDSLTNNAVDMYWDSALLRLFVSVSIADTGENGGRALFTVRVDDQGVNGVKLIFHEIAPTVAFTGAINTEVVATTVANETVVLSRVRTMHPSVGGSYVVVEKTGNLLYALPLVNESVDLAKASTWKTSVTHATLARKTTTPTDYYVVNPQSVPCFKARGFQAQATVAGHLCNTTDDAVRMTIGGAAVPGTISDVQVYKDTVFVATRAVTSPTLPGVFYSQALFDANGVIASWTPWQKISTEIATTRGFQGIGYSGVQGKLLTLDGAAAGGVVTPNTVKITDWGTNDLDGLLGGTTTDAFVGMIAQVNTQFPQTLGGVMGLFDFNSSNSAFAANALSLTIVTGYKKVVIIKTSAHDGTDFIPTVGDVTIDKGTFTSGAISNFPFEGVGGTANTAFISVTGGDLNDLGAINCATIVEETTDAARGGYIAVGGTGGVAILRETVGGAGWATTGLLNNLSHATAFSTSKAFQKIGTYANVRKLWTAVTSGGVQALYILTNNALYRVDVTTLNNATPTAVTIATLAGLSLPTHASFSDFIASDKLGILATSEGLYRTGNTFNVSTAATTTDVGWTKMTLPFGFTGITKLLPLSSTVNPYEFASATKPGQVYAMSSSVGLKNGAVYCFATERVNGVAVSATSLQLVHNPLIKDIDGTVLHMPFSYTGVYRNNFATNGATLLALSSQYLKKHVELARLPLLLGVGASFNKKGQTTISGVAGGAAIRGVERNSATGSWLVYGDKGLASLE